MNVSLKFAKMIINLDILFEMIILVKSLVENFIGMKPVEIYRNTILILKRCVCNCPSMR